MTQDKPITDQKKAAPKSTILWGTPKRVLDQERYFKWLTISGVPENLRCVNPLLRHDLEDLIRSYHFGHKTITTSRQRRDLAGFLHNPFETNIYALTCVDNETIVRYTAMTILASLYRTQVIAHNQVINLIYHRITDRYNDKLIKAKENVNPIGGLRPNLLVLTGVVANSTPAMVEALRIILDLYDNIPKIILSAGGSPADLSKKQLFHVFDKTMFLSSSLSPDDD